MALRIAYQLCVCLLLFGVQASCSSGSSENPANRDFDKPQEEAFFEEEKAAEALQLELEFANWESLLPAAARRQEVKEAVQKFYKKNAYQPLWNAHKKGGQSNALIHFLEQLEKEGLEPEDYPIAKLRKQLQNVQAGNPYNYDELARLDLMLSANYLLLARQLGKGRVEPGGHYSKWHIRPDEPDQEKNLRLAAEQGLWAALAQLKPDYRQYDLLKEELVHYRRLARKGGWQVLSLEEPLLPGDSSSWLPCFRGRLAKEVPLEDTSSPLFDRQLAETVRRLRYRYGLPGRKALIDAPLVEALNVPARERVEQIKLNLERSRWLTEPMGETYVLVNIPEYQLRVVEKGTAVMDMKVVVGEVVNTTPIFSDSLEYLVFAPYWNVPVSIAREEILPNAKKNPLYLEQKHYQLVKGWGENASVVNPEDVDWENLSLENFPYRVRQEPGPWNSLGKVKFIFPNDMAIYLHDTPADHLFSEYERGFSHGCIRIEEPLQLANYLLPDADKRKVQRLMQGGERQVVPLEEKIPVYLVYFTTVVDAQGALRFLPDIYELDKVQQQKI